MLSSTKQQNAAFFSGEVRRKTLQTILGWHFPLFHKCISPLPFCYTLMKSQFLAAAKVTQTVQTTCMSWGS